MLTLFVLTLVFAATIPLVVLAISGVVPVRVVTQTCETRVAPVLAALRCSHHLPRPPRA